MAAFNTVPLHLDVRDLRLVVAVADAGNLSRATKILHLTQSTLSHHLAELEGRLGATIFHRLGRRLALTPLGERLRDAAIPVLGSLRALEEDLRATDGPRRTTLRFATECYTTYPWLVGVIPSFRERWPNADVQVVAEATRDPLEPLVRGSLDLAIASGTPADRRFHVAVLFRDELVALVAPDHAWASRARVDPREFREVHLLTYASEPAESSFVRETLLPAGVLPRRMSGVPLTEGLAELAMAGLGVAVMARWAVESHLRERRLCAVRIGRTGVHRAWQAVRLHRHPEAALIDAFAALVRRHGPTTGRVDKPHAGSQRFLP